MVQHLSDVPQARFPYALHFGGWRGTERFYPLGSLKSVRLRNICPLLIPTFGHFLFLHLATSPTIMILLPVLVYTYNQSTRGSTSGKALNLDCFKAGSCQQQAVRTRFTIQYPSVNLLPQPSETKPPDETALEDGEAGSCPIPSRITFLDDYRGPICGWGASGS